MKEKLQGLIRPLVIALGLLILLYPSVSEYLSQKNSSRATVSYDDSVMRMEAQRLHALLEDARNYNQMLTESTGYEAPLSDELGVPITPELYWEILDVNDSGMMGYIYAPRLGEKMPIYHGTEESVLQHAIGHVQNTSLPVGGETTHAALSGHRGLPTASLFTDLDQMVEGDQFFITVLGETLAYQVDQITVAEPQDVEQLAMIPGRDLVTLITCTPYGVNSHRLLVRGTRIPYTPAEDGTPVIPEYEETRTFFERLPIQYRHLLVGLAALIGFLLLRIIWHLFMIFGPFRKKGKYE